MLRFFIVILFGAVSAESGIFGDGACPEAKPIENFDFKTYEGTWYEIARFPNIGEDGGRKGQCSTAEYTITSDDKGKVKNSHVVNNVKSFIEGDLTLLEPGKIMLTYTFGVVSKKSYLTVLDTDYKNYAIGYSCKYFEQKNNHQVFSWIMSRNKVLEGDVKTTVENYIKNSKIIDSTKYVYNDHSDETCKITDTQPIQGFIKKISEQKVRSQIGLY